MDEDSSGCLVEVDGQLSDCYQPSESELDFHSSSSDTEEALTSFDEDLNDPDFKLEVDVPRKCSSENYMSTSRKRKRSSDAVAKPRKSGRFKRKTSPEIAAAFPKPRKVKSARPRIVKSPRRPKWGKKKNKSSYSSAMSGKSIGAIRAAIRFNHERKARRRTENADNLLVQKPTRDRQLSLVVSESKDFCTISVVLPEIDGMVSKAVAVSRIPDRTKPIIYSDEREEVVLYRDLEELSPAYCPMTRYCELCGTDHTEKWSHHYLCHNLRRLPTRWRCKRCQQTFASVMAFTMHRPCQDGVFSCPVCFRVFSDLLPVFQHALRCLGHGLVPNYHCRLDLQYVMSNHENIVAYRCRHCPRSFTTSSEAAEHSVVHETSRASRLDEHTCKYCYFTFTNARACSVHESLHLDLQCPSCAVRFLNIDSLQNHLSTCCVIKNIPAIHQNCAFCGLSRRENYMSVSVIERKCENTHLVAKLCRTCGKVCQSQTKLGEHLRQVHREPANTYCERCNTWFPTRYLLMVHRTNRCYRVRLRRFACRFCRVRFTSRIELTRHQLKVRHDRRISKNFPKNAAIFQCTTCHKTFIKRHQLSLHRRLAHALSVHECSACGLKFMSRALLAAHQRVYHAAILFQCHVCQKRIRSRIGLDQHLINAHFQRFNCKICLATFEFEQDFEHHLSLHRNGEMCEKCGEKPHGQNQCATLSQYRLNRLNASKWNKNSMKPLRLRNYLECLVCRQSFTGNGVLHSYESHWNQHALGNQTLSKCPICVYETTEGPTDVFMHMMCDHADKFHKCLKCLLHFTNKETLQFHNKYCHLTPCWQLSTIKVLNTFVKCSDCDMLFVNHMEASKHASDRHVRPREEHLPCPRCLLLCHARRSGGTKRGTRHGLHIIECRNRVSVSCRRCSDVGDTSWFFKHMREKHGVLIVNSHPKPKSLQEARVCQHCGKEERDVLSLERHLFKRHRNLLDPNSHLVRLCFICGKEVFYMYWNMHHNTCSTERKFQCDKCDAKFKLKHHLQNHARTHEEKRFECKPCKMKFRLKHHLESHQRSFHGKEGYKCRECGKEFKLRWKRTKHRREVHGKTGDDSD